MPIDKIVVGPGLNQEKTVESVKYFLEKSGMEDLVEKVKASKIPYVAVQSTAKTKTPMGKQKLAQRISGLVSLSISGLRLL